MKLLLLLLSVFFLAACTGCYHASRPPAVPRTIAAQRDSAVYIQVECPDGSSSGSGVLLNGYLVLTAFHVVDCPVSLIKVTTREDDTRLMVVSRVDSSNDLALLMIAPGETRFPYPVPSVVIAERPPVGGVVCLESGSPQRGRQCGEVKGYGAEVLGNMHHLGLTIPGNSGSGVYNEKGELVGIVTHLVRCGGTLCGGLASTLDRGRLKKLLAT